ncbi:flagellar FliJ family protein [Agrobacterium tumefaciens]|uniref:Portal protein n=1 Tax=Agrobacterium tumefaciens TaxID=358 RepID=A0AA44F898_AGRTU|nr:flagellar FliJ family protein [Agrobacterium tumefaciens]NTB86851.1 portal protein [Agrobacterium tumefaciens]NTC21180.1 portal protein [Agrobacterium tumefaciens]NTC30728.1 portal protein [Agrobacterium tumefaciens]
MLNDLKHTSNESNVDDDLRDNISSMIAGKLQSATNFHQSTLTAQYDKNLRQYLRLPMEGDEKIKGRSKFVSSDVQERVGWAVAQILSVMDGQKSVVYFEPKTTEPYDVQIAKQQNTVINHILRERNSHVSLLTPWVQNGALFGLGVMYVDFAANRKESLPKIIQNVTDEQLVEYVAKEDAGDIIIVEVGDEKRIEIDPQILASLAAQMGMPIDPSQIDLDSLPDAIKDQIMPVVRELKIRNVVKNPEFTFKALAVEDFIVSADASIDVQTGGIVADIQGHRSYVTKDDLLERGYDEAVIDTIPTANTQTDPLQWNRQMKVGGNDIKPIGNTIEVYEIFTKTKIDDKVARPYRVTVAGSIAGPVVLGWQEVTCIFPYAPFVPFPLANTLWGQGIADRVGNEQDLISKIQRAILDNLHMHVDPIKILNPEVTSVDDALSLFAGKVVRSEDPTGGISYNQPAFAGMSAMPVIDQMKNNMDYVTGVGGQMVSIDPADLQRVAAGANTQRVNAQQLLIEQVCRQFADSGYRYLVRIIIDLCIQNPELAQQYVQRLTNNAVPFAIDDWSSEMDVSTTISFGSMDRDYRLSVLNTTLQSQMQAMQSGIAGPHQIYKTLVEIAETAGLQGAESYYIDPATLPPAPPPPEPVDPNKSMAEAEVLKAQLEAQADEKKREFEAYKLRVEDDFRRDELAQKLVIEQAEIAAKYGAQIDIARLELEMNKQRQDVEWAIERERLDAERKKQIEEQRQMDEAEKAQMMTELDQQAQMEMQMQMQQVQQPPMPPNPMGM